MEFVKEPSPRMLEKEKGKTHSLCLLSVEDRSNNGYSTDSTILTCQAKGVICATARLAWCIFLLLVFFLFPLSAQIQRFEYFIDTDPGIGKAIQVTGFTQNNKVEVPVGNISSANLTEGLHRMFVRAQDMNGRWSLTQTRPFYHINYQATSRIRLIEYFIDTDPGFGQGKQVATNAANVTQGINVMLDPTQSGIHTLYIRSQNDEGRWGLTQSRTFQQFYVENIAELNGLEYFIDADPGFGKANPMSISGASANTPFTVDITDLAPGLHTLYVRGRNTLMMWGLTHSITFIKTQISTVSDITRLEYFIDTDPGVGKATSAPVGTPASNITTYFAVNVEQIAEGIHTLYIRAKNETGRWSIVQNINFYKAASQDLSKVDRLEYFIDADPGFGKGKTISVIPSESVIKPFTVDLGPIAPGMHRLYIRARNTSGRWSITQSGVFVKTTMPADEPVTALEWFIDTDPGTGLANQVAISAGETVKTFSADFGDLPQGLHTLYVRVRNAAGSWSITQNTNLFRMMSPDAPDIVHMEYYIGKAGDPAPYFGQAIPIPFTPGQQVAPTFRVNLPSGMDEGWYTFNVRALDSNGQWSITQQQGFILADRMKNAELATLEYFLDTDPGFGKAKRVIISGNNQVLVPINSGEYSEGAHTIYLRAQNVKGEWGITQSFPILVTAIPQIADITALEYFIDTDPGVHAGIPVAIPQPGTNVRQTFNVSLSTLSSGVHTLYVRAVNQWGIWSITHYQTFIMSDLPGNYRPADIRRMEWFVDSDPGFDKANRVTMTGTNADSRFVVTLDNNVAPGFHQLYLRSQNAKGNWSITHSIPFLVAELPANHIIPDVTAVEWFIDDDPGMSRATKVPFDQSGQRAQQTFTVPISTLDPGMHTFYVRAINAKGVWSITQRQVFIKSDIPAGHQLSNLAKLEWFIDIDPGFGQGNSLDLLNQTATTTAFQVDIAGISYGLHTLYVRAVDKNGHWTHTQDIPFYHIDEEGTWKKNIAYLEYFMDDDPGFGKGKSIPIAKAEDIDKSFFIPLDNVWPGVHTFYFRAKDVRGSWSLTQSISLTVIDNPNMGGMSDVVALEYFIDTDPGFGKAKAVDISRNVSVNHRFFIEIDDIPAGLHTLYVRARNSRNQWGITHNIDIYNTGIPQFPEIPSIVAFEYFVDIDPGVGHAHHVGALSPDQRVQQQITVNVDTLKSGVHAIFVRAQDDHGAWSHTQRFNFIRAELPKNEPVTALEWFIDKDPGTGKGKPVTVTPGTSVDRNFNVTIPDTLAAGTHTLYVRARTATGLWSITHTIDFAIIKVQPIPGIAALEYFIDTDPGFGKGVSMPVPFGSLDAQVPAVVPLSGIAPGMHTFYVRAKNINEAWSHTQYMTFTVVKIRGEIKIMEMEYFVDDDPGFGKALKVSGFVPGTDIDKKFTVNLDTYAPGIHTLYIRTRNEENAWSITQDITFVRLEEKISPNIVKAEYFIDDFKEFGAGIDIPVNPKETSIQKVVPVNTAALAEGIHTLYVRVKDDKGRWSITQNQVFVKQLKHVDLETVALEWFIDTDPGSGKANPKPITATTSATVNIPIGLDDIEPGLHTLYIRAKNNKEQWGITHDITFLKLESQKVANISAIEYFIDTDPGFGLSPHRIDYNVPVAQVTWTTPVNTTALSPGIHTLYVRSCNEVGRWSITQSNTFVKVEKPVQSAIAALEWFIDDDPGFGTANPTTVGANISIPVTSLATGPHTLYVRARNAAGRWSITQDITFIKVEEHIKPGIAGFEWFIDTDPGFGQANQVSLAGSAATNSFIFDVDNIPNGLHTLYMRARDENGQWSLTQDITFSRYTGTMASKILALEWFIDDDPGFGNAPASQQKTFDTTGVARQNVIHTFRVDVSQLDMGMHTLYVRAKNGDGNWSITQYESFAIVKSRDINALEWFIDEDLGFGENTIIHVTPSSSVNTLIHIPSETLADGAHSLYLRAKNDADSWGITQSIDFIKVAFNETIVPDIARIEYFFNTDPGFGKGTIINTGAGTNITQSFTAQMPPNSAPGLHTFYVRAQDTLGNWSHTQYHQFVKIEKPIIPNIVALEWFIDTDPGFGQATHMPVAGTTSATGNINLTNVEPGLHTLYVRALDASDHWSHTHSIEFASIDPNAERIAKTIAIEYFFDNDPGFGRANLVPGITAGLNVVKSFHITLPANFEPGLHTFYVRARNEDGRWSITQYNQFIKVEKHTVSNTVALEYFIDNDPGFGKGTSQSFTPGTAMSQSFNVNIDNVEEGLHTLYVRALDANQRWGITHSIEFLKIQVAPKPVTVVAAEYFIDDDPGFGKATPVPAFASAGTISRTFAVSLNGLDNGEHTLYIRALDNQGHWSITQYQSFLKAVIRIRPQIEIVEYFIDDDPGFGKGKRLTVSPSATEFTLPFMLTADQLTSGAHTLYIRSLDNQGHWSITHDISLLVLDMQANEISKVKALEYFIDNDPGFRKGKIVNITPVSEMVSRKFFVPTASLADGVHTLYVRAINEDETWSITQYNTFVKITPIKRLPDIIRIEYFIGNDPGFGKGKPIPVSPDINVSKTFNVDLSDVVTEADKNNPTYEGLHTLYIRSLNSEGKWAITHTFDLKISNRPPADTGDQPQGGAIFPAYTEVCQGRVSTVDLRATGFSKRVGTWESRIINEDGTASQWTTVAGSTNKTLLQVAPNTAGVWQYRAQIYDGDRGPESSLIAEVKVIAAAVGGKVTDNTPEYVCSGKSFKLNLEEYKGDIVRWQERNTSATTAWTNIVQTDEEITVTPVDGGIWEYRAEVAMGTCSNAFSATTAVNVISSTTGGIIDPETFTACLGKSFELNAKNYLGKIERWQRSTDDGNTWTNIAHTSATYVATEITQGAVQYRAVVKAGNCDETFSQAAIITVVDKIEAAGTIVGPDFVCIPDEKVRYSILPIPSVDSYMWTLPNGAAFSGANNGNEILVDYSASTISGSITVKGVSNLCGSGAASILPIEVHPRPATPVINGPASVCVGQMVTYEVPQSLADVYGVGATYIWTLPAGWTGSSTTRTITVTPNGIGGTISVTVVAPVTGCTSAPKTMNIFINPGFNTGPIYRLPNN